MRRATRPAIWTTPILVPRRLDHEGVALVVLARLVELGIEEEARRVEDLRDPAR